MCGGATVVATAQNVYYHSRTFSTQKAVDTRNAMVCRENVYHVHNATTA